MVGAILVRMPAGETWGLIGPGDSTADSDEETDCLAIANWGCHLTYHQACALFGAVTQDGSYADKTVSQT